jgi:hypothetical protein
MKTMIICSLLRLSHINKDNLLKSIRRLLEELKKHTYIYRWLWGRVYFTFSASEDFDPEDVMDCDGDEIKFKDVDANTFIRESENVE